MIPVARTGSGSRDMAAIMERVRKMSDSQLADILAGKDVSIPQFAAMTEAMGRKQLRQAVDGAQAQQQAQQPSIKEQLLAEQRAPRAVAGIDQLPAANMESIDMASGGIVAFDNGGGVYADPLSYLSGQDVESMAADELRRQKELQKYKELYGYERYPNAKAKPTAPAAAAAAAPVVPPPDADKTSATGKTSAAPAATGIAGIDVSAPTKFERRASPFGQLSTEAVDYNKLKDQGLGEGLMKMAAGLLSAPGTKGVAAGIQALAESGQLTRKEIAGLKKDARDYDLNRTRAEEAFNQGQDELGLKYTEAANVNKYRMASLAKEPDALVTARAALNDPRLAAIIGKEGKADLYSLKDATTEFNDLAEKNPKRARELAAMGINSPAAYRQFVITGLPPMQVVGTLDKGAVVRN
jgi:hypothetical protein